jgi:hypothetical protein
MDGTGSGPERENDLRKSLTKRPNRFRRLFAMRNMSRRRRAGKNSWEWNTRPVPNNRQRDLARPRVAPLVYYSIADFGDPRYERQWRQSIRSLRAYNELVPVHLVLYNGAPKSILREADLYRVTVQAAGSLASRLHDLIPRYADALSRHPVLHKVLSLHFLPAGGVSQILYLDCDTFFFGDVFALFEQYRDRHFYAREEPLSRRSHYGYQSSYLDEDALAQTYAAERLAFIPPYNMGVFVLNRGLSSQLARVSGKFLVYAWRLLLDISENQRLARRCNRVLLSEVRRSLKHADFPPMSYPSNNCWIVDEIAMMFTLAGVPGLTHHSLRRKDVAQGDEYNTPAGSPRPTLVHYYSVLEQRFFKHLKRCEARKRGRLPLGITAPETV